MFLSPVSLWPITEAVALSSSFKKVFLETSQNSQENTCARVSFLIKFITNNSSINFTKNKTLAHLFSCKFWEISKSNVFYRTPPAAASSMIAALPSW